MSLVEQLFPAAELAAMKHAVLSTTEEPSPKRRKVGRQNSQRSYHSADSGYNSDESSNKCKPTLPSLFTQRRPSQQACESAPSPGSVSEEEDFCQKIARARARLYSNASLHSSGSPTSQSADSATSPESIQDNYHSPVSVESLASTASTSGCNLGTFINLGLAVTSYERNLLTSLAPEPKAMPNYDTEVLRAQKMQWLMQRRRAQMEEQQRQRKTSYQGFAISLHEEEDDEETEQKPKRAQTKQVDETALSLVKDEVAGSPEQLDDFFNIDAASEEALSEAANE